MNLKQKTRHAIFFAIFVAYELFIVIVEVSILAILFVLPTLIGLLLRVAYVQRKKTLQKLQVIFRNKYAHTIVRLSQSKYFKDLN